MGGLVGITRAYITGNSRGKPTQLRAWLAVRMRLGVCPAKRYIAPAAAQGVSVDGRPLTLLAELISAARRGDLTALDVLVSALPVELPPTILRAQRDIQIREIARHIAALLPDASCRRIAGVISAAGAHLEGGRRSLSGCPACRLLTASETVALASTIMRILEWAPSSGHGGLRWPGHSQMRRIIGDRAGGSPPAVEMSRRSA